jgi:hypothetical protein
LEIARLRAAELPKLVRSSSSGRGRSASATPPAGSDPRPLPAAEPAGPRGAHAGISHRDISRRGVETPAPLAARLAHAVVEIVDGELRSAPPTRPRAAAAAARRAAREALGEGGRGACSVRGRARPPAALTGPTVAPVPPPPASTVQTMLRFRRHGARRPPATED